jgi:hypothetical protein
VSFVPFSGYVKPLALVCVLALAIALISAPIASGAARVPVTSSFIAAIGWTNGTLQVELLNGRIYEYCGVPRAAYSAFLSAPSKGKYFNTYIRGHYAYKRIR